MADFQKFILAQNLLWLTDAQGARIAAHLTSDMRGAPQKDCPPEHCPHATADKHFVWWAELRDARATAFTF